MTKSSFNYPGLEIISGIYKGLAWIVAVFTVFTTIFFMTNLGGLYYYFIPYGVPRLLVVFLDLIIGGLSFLSLIGISEIIKVFLNIEQNTRSLKDI